MSLAKNIDRISDGDLMDFPFKGQVEGWAFRFDEISQGYYRVEGIDRFGRTVSRDGVDPDKLLEKCEEDARKMIHE